MPISDTAALVLAYIAMISILENRRTREQDRALDQKFKALDEIRGWAHVLFTLTHEAYSIDQEVLARTKALLPVHWLAGSVHTHLGWHVRNGNGRGGQLCSDTAT